MRKNKENVLVFDIGGTKISSGVVEIRKDGYKIFDYQKVSTPRRKDKIIQKIAELAVYYQKDNGFGKIGMGIAGQVDSVLGTVKFAPNIQELSGVNMKNVVEKITKKKTKIENDVKCFAIAERKFGKSGKYKNVVYLAVGTGIGGAVEINGKLYRGNNNIAGEFGHMVLFSGGEKCECGRSGCFEKYVSGRAIEKIYYDLYRTKKSARDIAVDSKKGSEKEGEVINKASLYFAEGLANIINIINPEIIVIGGSVVKEKEILNLAKKEALKRALPPGRKTIITNSKLEDEAVLVGAGLL